MRLLASLPLVLVMACVTTEDPNAPHDGEEPLVEEADGGTVKDTPDARQRPDGGGLSIVPRADGGPPPVQLDAGNMDPPKGKRIFVSSAAYDGDLKTAGGGTSGVDGADRLCQGLATTANLGGSWKALVSTATQSGVDRMSNVGPYYRLDGEKAFENRDAMRTQPLAAIDVTEVFTQLAADGAWTGTLYGGLTIGPAVDTTCADWESSSGDYLAIVGDISETSASWIDYGGGGVCSDTWRLYCVEQ